MVRVSTSIGAVNFFSARKAWEVRVLGLKLMG
jgi:hypothetical protein